MEKRKYIRNRAEIPITCWQLSTRHLTNNFAATMINYSSNGTCIKSGINYAKGTILLIRILKYPAALLSKSINEMVRSISLAEVKWVVPIDEDGMLYFGIGLRYLR